MAEKIIKSGLIVPGINDHIHGVITQHLTQARNLTVVGIDTAVSHVPWMHGQSLRTKTDRLTRAIKNRAEDTGQPVVLFGAAEGGTLSAVVALQNPDLEELDKVVLLSSPVVSKSGLEVKNPILAQAINVIHAQSDQIPQKVRAKIITVRLRAGKNLSEEATHFPGVETVVYDYESVGPADGVNTILSDAQWLKNLVSN
jgi:pimeloyl-ACP methyl ester carboxylesterase